MRLSEADHRLVTQAVTEAERHTDGEIVTIVARQSDGYTDVALHWAVLVAFLVGAIAAWEYPLVERLYLTFGDGWVEAVPVGGLLTTLLLLMAAAFIVMRLAMIAMPVRLALTLGFIEAQRVRAAAVSLFRTAAEQRTVGATGVLLYVSIAERRAEIIADAAIHGLVAPEVWGDAMADLVTAMRRGEPGEGIKAAVTRIGVILTEHFPKTEGNPNELPDRLIEL